MRVTGIVAGKTTTRKASCGTYVKPLKRTECAPQKWGTLNLLGDKLLLA
jgi:hypothetical protein